MAQAELPEECGPAPGPDGLAERAVASTRRFLRLARTHADPAAALAAALDDLVQMAEQSLSAAVATDRRAARDQARVACRAGCDACCHIPLAVTALEAIAVAAAVRGDAALSAHVLLAGPVVAGAAPAQRWQQRLPCALLHAGKCAVYASRPLPCRGYVSFRADRCHEALRSGDRDAQLAIPLWDVPHVIASSVRNGIRTACAAEGVEDAHIELSGAVATVLADPDSVRHWLAGNIVFATAAT